MPGIDETVIAHKLSISPTIKPVSQRKRKVGEEGRAAITEEVPVWLHGECTKTHVYG
jgi:hypothetical protein